MTQGYAPTGTPNVPVGVRGSTAQAASTNTFTVFFPAGSQAGDLAIMFAEAGYSVGTPAGWTQQNFSSVPTFNAYTFSKTLTSGDIATGFVTVNIGGAFDASVALIVFIGS